MKSISDICISGIIWLITEISCKYSNNKILLIGHPLWHFGVAYGTYNLIKSISIIRNKISELDENNINL